MPLFPAVNGWANCVTPTEPPIASRKPKGGLQLSPARERAVREIKKRRVPQGRQGVEMRVKD